MAPAHPYTASLLPKSFVAAGNADQTKPKSRGEVKRALSLSLVYALFLSVSLSQIHTHTQTRSQLATSEGAAQLWTHSVAIYLLPSAVIRPVSSRMKTESWGAALRCVPACCCCSRVCVRERVPRVCVCVYVFECKAKAAKKKDNIKQSEIAVVKDRHTHTHKQGVLHTYTHTCRVLAMEIK